MNMPVRFVAAAVMCVGLAACVRTTDGSVAMTTEPGGTTTTTTGRTSPNTTRPSVPTSTSEVPAPPNATTITCAEYTKLDQDARLAVVKEILADEPNVFGPLGDELAEQMATTMCQFLPEQTVAEVLTGTPPP